MTWMIEGIRVAAVDPGAVFRLGADPATWTSWGPSATRVRSDGPLAEVAAIGRSTERLARPEVSEFTT